MRYVLNSALEDRMLQSPHPDSWMRGEERMSQDFHFDFRHSAMCFPSLPLSTSRHALHRSKPCPHTHDESNLARIATFLAHKGSRLAEAFVEGEADIGRKLAPDFIAEPKPKFQVVEP